jgi:hypothetical protein
LVKNGPNCGQKQAEKGAKLWLLYDFYGKNILAVGGGDRLCEITFQKDLIISHLP